ncbi:hypothetical protein [Saccharopolyspora cebuensis]|uniref:Uncharacterized protein n=1 Tax=Saccharopolyspora cebuensis TaxID=418759 RepID=A0ABV4CQS0_9PSEU
MSTAVLMLRAVHWPLFAAGCAVVAALNAVLGAIELPVPVPNTGEVDVPLGLFSPLLLACGIGLHVKSPTRLWDTSPRPRWPVRAGWATAAFLPAVLACTPLLLHGGPLWAAGVRNVLGLGGMALLTAVAAGATRSWMVPFPYVLAALLLGTAGPEPHSWWAFAVHDASDARGAALALALLCTGVTAFVIRGARPEH